ncbi:hypothetical protein GCM10025794_22220 [Massilia kyonggiensis]|nr:hypothetical protein [Massilia kyonggiensis]
MSRVNNEQMKALVAAFMEHVTGGAPVDEAWRSRTAAMAPELPALPTPAQIEAWTELAGMLQDPDVVRKFEAGISAFWDGARDADAYQYAAGGSRARLQELLAVLKGDTPAAEETRAWRWLIEAARAAAL